MAAWRRTWFLVGATVLLMALQGGAVDLAGGSGDLASLAAGRGARPLPRLFGLPQEPEHIDTGAALDEELPGLYSQVAKRVEAAYRTPQRGKVQPRDPFGLDTITIDWGHLAKNGHARPLPKHIFTANVADTREPTAKDELAEVGVDDTSLEGVTAAAAVPSKQDTVFIAVSKLSDLAHAREVCKSTKELCETMNTEQYAAEGLTITPTELEAKCSATMQQCEAQTNELKTSICDKYQISEDSLPEASAAWLGESVQGSQSETRHDGRKYLMEKSEATEVTLLQLEENEDASDAEELVSRVSEAYTSNAGGVVQRASRQNARHLLLKATDSAKANSYSSGNSYSSANSYASGKPSGNPYHDPTSLAFSITSLAMKANVPAVETMFGSAAYAKILCKKSQSACNLGSTECDVLLGTCMREAALISKALCHPSLPTTATQGEDLVLSYSSYAADMGITAAA